MSTYAVSVFPTPIFNTPHFPYHSSSLSPFKDAKGLIKSIESIALPGSKFFIQKEVNPHVLQVTTSEYHSEIPLYVDERFLQQASSTTPERQKKMPPAQEILDFMRSQVGTRYFWGGNWAQGIPEMITFYPHLSKAEDQDDVLCKGLDCSGLLYQSTLGMTPRNTSQLVYYGKELAVNPPSFRDFEHTLQALDMLVWNGHVAFILNPEEMIESLGGKGVIISPLSERFSQVQENLRKENKTLYLRRWHPDFLS